MSFDDDSLKQYYSLNGIKIILLYMKYAYKYDVFAD